jgi:hypothetical protein
MNKNIKIVLVSVFIYWLFMWLSVLSLMLYAGGIDSFAHQTTNLIILSFIVLTLILSPVVFFSWLFIIKKWVHKKGLSLFLWNLTMWIIITAICEKSFHVLSGNTHGLSDFRRGWYQFLLLSTVYVSISYWFARKKLQIKF